MCVILFTGGVSASRGCLLPGGGRSLLPGGGSLLGGVFAPMEGVSAPRGSGTPGTDI